MVAAVSLLAAWALAAPLLSGHLIVEAPLRRADVIVVLAGSRDYLERTEKAALLFRQEVAPGILLADDGNRAGWSREEQRNPAFVELALRSLVARGVPAKAIEVLPTEVSGTIAEARLTARRASAARWRSVLIVTSAHHTRRALRTFERVFSADGVDARVGIVAATGRPPWSMYWWLTVHGWIDVAGEYPKSAFYAAAH